MMMFLQNSKDIIVITEMCSGELGVYGFSFYPKDSFSRVYPAFALVAFNMIMHTLVVF